MIKKLFIFSMYLNLIVLGSTVLTGCGEKDVNNPSAGAGSNAIGVKDSFYDIKEKNILVGSTVEWSWQGNIGHSVTGGTPPNPNGSFDSGVISMGSFSQKFDTEGTFRYYCKVHGASMTGTIIVAELSDGGVDVAY